MTHEELLATITYITGEFWVRINTNDSELLNAGDALSALRAIVELHKPLYYRKGEADTKGAHCSECSQGSHLDTAIEYPCDTIQAIEKELK